MEKLKKLVRKNIRVLAPYTSARDEFTGKEGVFLDANENPYGELNRYPDPYQRQLKSLLAEEKSVAPSQIFIGNGSDEVIDLLVRIFCEPGSDKIVTFAPTYGMYKVVAAINDVELIELPLTNTFDVDDDLLAPFWDDEQYKLLFLCSPNNPTGRSIEQETLIRILEKFKGIVLVDEAYIDFSQKASAVEYLAKYPNLIVSQTFSKAWGLAAARVGVGYANSWLVALLNKIKPPYNVSQLNQQAAINALENRSVFETNLKQLQKEKERLYTLLGSSCLVEKIFYSDGNFFLVKIQNIGATQLYDALKKRGIIIRNRSTQIDSCLRITVGSKVENDELIKALLLIEEEVSRRNTI